MRMGLSIAVAMGWYGISFWLWLRLPFLLVVVLGADAAAAVRWWR